MLVGVAVLAVIAPAAEPGESRAEAAPPVLSTADDSAPRLGLVPIAAPPVMSARPGAVRPTAALPDALLPGTPDALWADDALWGNTAMWGDIARAGTVRAERPRARSAASRSAARRPASRSAARTALPHPAARPALAHPATRPGASRAATRPGASRSAARLPVRPPMVPQRFTPATAAKLSAVAQAAKPRPEPRVVPRATGPGRDRGHDRRGAAGHRTARHDSVQGRERDSGGHGMSAVIAYAWAQVGKPYVMGAEGPDVFDCSGFTMQAYKRAGLHLPHSSGGQAAMARTVSRSEARPGDLVVGPGHVGIYLGDGMMIDAGNSRVGVVYREVYDGLHIERLF